MKNEASSCLLSASERMCQLCVFLVILEISRWCKFCIMGLLLFWASLLCSHVHPSYIEKCYWSQWIVIARVVRWLLLGFEEVWKCTKFVMDGDDSRTTFKIYFLCVFWFWKAYIQEDVELIHEENHEVAGMVARSSVTKMERKRELL